MSKVLRLSIYIIVILATVVFSSTVVLGYDWSYTDFGSTTSSSANPVQQVVNTSGQIAAFVRFVGVFLGVAMVFILAIQYITINNSPEKKAAIKLRSGLLAIGIILLFGITGIMDLFADIGRMARGTGSAREDGGGSAGGSGGGLSGMVQSGDADAGDEGFFNKEWGNLSSVSSTTNSGPIDNNGQQSYESGTETQTQTQTQISGYRPTTAADPTQLKAGDRIYYGVDGNNLIPGGDWDNSEYYYDLQHGDKIMLMGGKYILNIDGDQYELGNTSGGNVNCFDGIKGNEVSAGGI